MSVVSCALFGVCSSPLIDLLYFVFSFVVGCVLAVVRCCCALLVVRCLMFAVWCRCFFSMFSLCGCFGVYLFLAFDV